MHVKSIATICLTVLALTLGCTAEKTEESEATAEEETTTTTTETDGTVTTTTTATDGTTTTTATKPDGTKVTKVKKPDGSTTTTTVATDGATTTTTVATDGTTTETTTPAETETPTETVADACTLTANTTASTTTNAYGCNLTTRDTSSCEATRTAQGLSGHWLKFSCRVTLTKTNNFVELTSDGQPDHKSPYFGSTNDCYTALSTSATAAGRGLNPLSIASQSFAAKIPFSGTAAVSTSSTGLGVIGFALNGVAIFNNAAAPGDSIYDEVATFDQCEGHPNSASIYHYHIEPPAISNSDSAFVGVMRDGFPIYGVKDADGTTPTLDAAGGHTGTTVDSPSTAVYHYHVNLQTSGSDSAYFISTGYFKGTKGTCTGC